MLKVVLNEKIHRDILRLEKKIIDGDYVNIMFYSELFRRIRYSLICNNSVHALRLLAVVRNQMIKDEKKSH